MWGNRDTGVPSIPFSCQAPFACGRTRHWRPLYPILMPSTICMWGSRDTGVPSIPFSATELLPVMITVKARNLNYNASGKGLVWANAGIPPHSPITSTAPLETITLVLHVMQPFTSTV